MKKIISVICAVVFLLSSVSVSAFALTKTEAEENLAAQNEVFNRIFKQPIYASDAREVLLTSAGLESENENSEFFDIDKDGMITAIDARIYLRIAAKLDNINNYFNDVKLDYFLAIINSIKPNTYNYYQSKISTVDDIEVDDSNEVFDSIQKQLNNVAKVFELLGFGEDLSIDVDIKESLESGEKSQESQIGINRVSNSLYPIKGNELACLATLDDIAKFEYKTNQTYTFKMNNSSMKEELYSDQITGLDSLTIYLKQDKAISLNGNLDNAFDGLIAGKAFDVLSANDINNNISLDLSLNDLEDLKDFGKIDVKIIPNKLQYSNCYVTVYFYPETGKPVVTEHNLDYAIDTTVDMLIDLDPSSIDKVLEDSGIDIDISKFFDLLLFYNDGKFLYVNDDVAVKHKMNENTTYYFYKNNPNHKVYVY